MIQRSTYVKLYLLEKGSDKARNIARKSRIISSAILLIECLSAISKKRYSHEIEECLFHYLVDQIKADFQYVETIRLTEEVLEKACDVIIASNAGTLDAIHIASALLLQAGVRDRLTFVTSDKRQQEIADQHGLRTIIVG